VHRRLGVTTSDEYETELKRAGMESAEQRILLVDSSKFGRFTQYYFADIDQFDTIITDNLLDKSLQTPYLERGISLIIV
jgi:DeoR family deoxyribose operon repressor